jgi:hypothetical protein
VLWNLLLLLGPNGALLIFELARSLGGALIIQESVIMWMCRVTPWFDHMMTYHRLQQRLVQSSECGC